MRAFVLLDSGPLSLLAHPREDTAAEEWIGRLKWAGAQVVIPEIADYEVRRELLRARKTRSIGRLDKLKSRLVYAPITTEVMLLAAAYWAEARNLGRPTAPDDALDADVIIAALATRLAEDYECEAIVATTNPGHLSLFVDARPWQEIT